MKKIKTELKFLFNGIVLITFLAFGFVGCEQDQIQVEEESVETNLRKPAKIDVCHYSADDDQWILLNVSENSWAAHVLHGDVRLDDQDGDSFVPDNECGFGSMGDCDDTNPDQYPGAEEFQPWFQLFDDDGDNWYVYLGIIEEGTCRPAGYFTLDEASSLLLGDCDDSNPDVYPGAPEICDDIDNNCNGLLFIRSATVSFQGQDVPLLGHARFGPEGTVSGPWTTITGPFAACQPWAEDLTGKIVFIDRGDCNFVDKVMNAQGNGAIGIIICSSNPIIGVMIAPAGFDISQITIPSILLRDFDCATIQQNEPIVSFTVTDICVEPGRASNNMLVGQETPNTHTIDFETGEIIELNISQ